ncbi:hypothetical protein [Thioalkalivibrio sp. HK1]|uniref:hypothetical protein n=1 Tax=Thioalkalivibrio sp. HK1 TaxID=1469245 RepID=UPI0012DED3CE|nr:hypothetical protein [Thioalkalivibrio sp. HK1]
MSEPKMTLVFEGSAVENGAIDVQDLAPAILSLGELIQAANHEINGDRAKISIKMRAVSEGSFEVDLISIQSIIEQAKGLYDWISNNESKIATANEILDFLFKLKEIAGGTVAGLIILIIWLRGRKPDRIEYKEGNVHIHIGDNYITTDPQTLELAKSRSVRKQARKFVSSLSKEGIENIRVRRPDSKDINIRKEDIEYFEFEEGEDDVSDTIRDINLQIINLSFKEDNQWRVTDGDLSFSVTIEDNAFLDRIANNEIAFSKGDFLVCSVREKQTLTSDGLKMKRSIVEVKDHRPGARQSKLQM